MYAVIFSFQIVLLLAPLLSVFTPLEFMELRMPRSWLLELPYLVWEDHLVPHLSLSEVLLCSSLNSSFYELFHNAVTLNQEVQLSTSVSKLASILKTWPNMTRIHYKPFFHMNTPYIENVWTTKHYNKESDIIEESSL
jgi:hypothetical protein